jgi:hypothetical protein
MNGDELLVISALDQDVELSQDGEDVLERIEQMILLSIKEGNVRKALHICQQLNQIIKLSGLALAKAFYIIKVNWDKFKVSDNFYDTIASAMGLRSETVQRYVAVWEMHDKNKIPAEFADDILKKNIKMQIPIAQALNMGYEITNDEWRELRDASDFSEVNNKLREIKGKEPRAHALTLMIDREGGIKALKNGEQKYVGWLNTSDEDEIVQQAIERLCKGGGILQQ